ncbi:hypothetical protein BKA83DRAFT_678762 [Pisolithus microcarpus]|nr:hypothetical protein BKA83DRAFT_678762 [Pisolithus microcarpus]
MDELHVECPIHLDATFLAFNCGHGFCVPCLDAHFSSRPTRERCIPALPHPHSIYCPRYCASSPHLTPHPTPVIDLTTPNEEIPSVLISWLKEKNSALLSEINTLRDDLRRARSAVESHMTLQANLEDENSRLRGECDRSREEISGLREVNMRAQGRNLQRALTAKRQAIDETRNERDRVRLFEGRCQTFKKQLDLEKKKRKALESENRQLRLPPPDAEDESLTTLDHEKPDLAWLEDACTVQAARSTTEEGSVGGDFPPRSLDAGGRWPAQGGETEVVDDRDRPLPLDRECPPRKPLSRFPSDWSLGPEAEISLGVHRKRKHGDSRPTGSKFFKVKHSTRSENVGGSSSDGRPHRSSRWDKWLETKLPLAIDNRGRVQGTVTVGSRQRLNSKN